ncbi:MAG: ABC transporter ATP-binding protein [Paracoccaceae bacterium]
MLEIENLVAGYNNVPILKSLNISANSGDITVVIGPNGAGKSTLLKTISGLIPTSSGSIRFDGNEISKMPPDEIVKLGIIHVPEGRMIFNRLTVSENLLMGAFQQSSTNKKKEDFDRVLQLFPIISKRLGQLGGTLSGGEQQMLAIGRGLMSSPKLLMLDEPSLGIAPIVVEQIFNLIEEIKKTGVSILMVEQNASKALKAADFGYVLELGNLEASGSSASLLKDNDIKRYYLGI